MYCSLDTCRKSFAKSEGAFALGTWFCSQRCADMDPRIQQMQEIKRKIAAGGPANANAEDDDEDDIVIDL